MAADETWQVHVEFTAGTWTDITSYVDSVAAPITISRGRSAEVDQIQPGTLTVTLDNSSHRFTPGNTGSLYYPNVKQARRIRVRQVVGCRGFDLFTGYIEFPEIVDWAQSGVDQTITITATDGLARLAKARPFVSTLAEYVRFNGGTALRNYWPLLDAGTPVADVVGSGPPMVASTVDSTLAPITGSATVGYQQGVPLRGDDVAPVALTSATNAGVTAQSMSLAATYPWTPSALPTVAAGDLVTLVAWVHPDFLTLDETQTLLFMSTDDASISLDRMASTDLAPGQQWRLRKPQGGLTGSVNGAHAVSNAWYPVGFQWSYSPNSYKLWIAAEEFVGTLSGTPSVTPIIIRSVGVAVDTGSVAHVQLYLGSYTQTQFLAQMQAGYTGLPAQRTDERIRTIGRYSGLTDAEMVLDRGCGWMQPARLAGQRPSEALDTVAATELGRIFFDGAGRLVAHSRVRTTYNL